MNTEKINKKHCPNPKGSFYKIISKKCKYCGEMFNCRLTEYLCHVKWCKQNPNRNKFYLALQQVREKHSVGHPAWNKGKTKETDVRIARQVATLKARYASGQLIGSFVGRTHSKESRKKISEKGRQNPYQRICKKTVSYTKPDGTIVKLDSTYEISTAKLLDKLNILWIRPKPLIWVDSKGKNHNYFPDFLILQANIYLDPKNDYCFRAQREKIDYVKSHYSNVIFLYKEDLEENKLRQILKNNGVDFEE